MKAKELLKQLRSEKKLERDLQFTQDAINVEDRTVDVVITTNAVVDRGGYFEQVNLSKVDLSRVEDGVLAVIENHDRRQRQIGRVISARVEGDALLGTLLFSRSKHADEVFVDIQDGVIQAFSIGMSVTDVKVLDEDADKPTLIFEGQFQELSVVGVPADPAAKVIGRSLEDEEIETKTITKERKEMPDQTDNTAAFAEIERKAAEKHAADAKVERSRVSSITAIAEQYKIEGAAKAIAEGASVESFQEKALEEMVERGEAQHAEVREVELTKAEKKQYSLSRAVLAAGGHHMKDAGFELEVSRALVDAGNSNAQGGILIPCDMYRHAANPIMERASQQTVGTAADGGNLVSSNFRADMFVEALYNNSAALGRITVLSGLAGNVVIPTSTGKHTGYWVAEDAAPTTSKMTFGQRTLSPKTLAAHGSMSLLTLRQNTPSIDALVRADLARIMATTLDAGVFQGDGTGGAPTGLLNFAGIPTQLISKTTTPDVSTPTWAEIVAFEQVIAEGNYSLQNVDWTVAPALVTYMKTTLRDAGVSGYIMDGAGKGVSGYANGYEVKSSTNVTDNNDMILGDMSQLVMGQFGQALEIITDRSATNGALEIGVFTVADTTVLQTAAFCKSVLV